MTPNSLNLRAPAKLNLTLAVLRRRPDGFHDLQSHVIKLDWADEISLLVDSAPSLEVRGPASEGVPRGAENLVIRAMNAMAHLAGAVPDVSMVLTKHLPHGAGLGGGSSDAAAVLLGLRRLWSIDVSDGALSDLGASLGSDIPLFLNSGDVIMEGRGERVRNWRCPWRGFVAVVIPPFGLSTPAVYSACSPRGSASQLPALSIDSDVQAESLARRLFNDLEAPAFEVEPRLKVLHASIDGLLSRTVRMTGSGSALFALFDRDQDAQAWRMAAMAAASEAVRIHIARTA